MEHYKEDDLTSALIQMHTDRKLDNIQCQRIQPEAHYNYYGTRGVVDLYVLKEKEDLRQNLRHSASLYEVKAELRNANEVLRQFNRMKEFFFKDPSRPEPDTAKYELTVLPTRQNYRHIEEYYDMYKSVGRIFFRHPEDPCPVPIVAKDLELGTDEWKQMAKNMNREIWQTLCESHPSEG